MNLDQARELRANGLLLSAEILPNPSKTGGWFLTILDTTCKSYLIVDDQAQVITVSTVDEMLMIVRAVGLRSVSIRLG
jgi:hypothetical protein